MNAAKLNKKVETIDERFMGTEIASKIGSGGLLMQRRKLGLELPEVSEIGFGGAAVSGLGGGYGFGEISDEEAEVLIKTAFESGINLFDTAPVFGCGLSERRIGSALRSVRDQVVLISKCGVVWDQERPFIHDGSPKLARKMLEQSLVDLGTDYIDLYLIQGHDRNYDIRERVAGLLREKEAGKIRAIGICDVDHLELLKAMEAGPIEAVQNEFNLFNSDAAETLFPLLSAKGVGFIGWGSLDKGVLTGRVTLNRERSEDFHRKDFRMWANWWKRQDRGPKYRAVGRLQIMAKESEDSLLAYSLGHVLSYQEVSCALVGMRSVSQLQSAIETVANLPSAKTLKNAYLACRMEMQRG